MRIIARHFTLLVVVLAIPAVAGASGWVNREPPKFEQGPNTIGRNVDQFYEFGKAIYVGRGSQFEKIKYCVAERGSDPGGKLRGKTVKPYKGGDANEFGAQLFDCDEPERRINSVLAEVEMFAVLYYLNKRYKMNMTVSSDFDPTVGPAPAPAEPGPEPPPPEEPG